MRAALCQEFGRRPCGWEQHSDSASWSLLQHLYPLSDGRKWPSLISIVQRFIKNIGWRSRSGQERSKYDSPGSNISQDKRPFGCSLPKAKRVNETITQCLFSVFSSPTTSPAVMNHYLIDITLHLTQFCAPLPDLSISPELSLPLS